MKSLTNIKDIAFSPFRKLGKSPEYDWYFALSCFAISILVVAVIDSVLFLNATSLSDEEIVGENTPFIKLKRADIDESVKNMLQKDVDSSVIPKAILEDPSI